MKIHQILDGIPVFITNEERDFIQKFQNSIPVLSLCEHENWVAQNLVRKGVYKITNDNKQLVIVKKYENRIKNF